jgi:hypothetical protein
MEIRFALVNGMFKMKMDIDHRGPRPMPNSCKNLNLPNFSLPSTFNVPVVFMARYVMILGGATSLQGALEGVGPKNRDFFGP